MSQPPKKRSPLVATRTRAGSAKPGAQKKSATKPPKRPAKTPTKSRQKAPKQGGILRRLTRGFGWLIWVIASRSALVVAMMILAGTAYFYTQLPDLPDFADGRAQGSVTFMDRYGRPFAWRGQNYGGAVDAQSVSPHLKNAVVATEDKRFYSHFGLSPRGIASAIRINLREGRGALSGHGGSTITQQTAKLLCLGVPYDPDIWPTQAKYEADCRQSTLWRKIKEALFSFALEARYSKDQILSLYLNRAYMGGGAYGAEAAAQRFFGKPAALLTPAESAMLAGLLTAPTTFAPTTNLQRAQNRAGVVLGLMQDQGYLSQAEADFARAHPAQLSQQAQARAGGYFVDWIMQTGPDFFTRQTTEDVVMSTTFDPAVQKAAEDALRQVFETRVSETSKAQAAIVVMTPDGAVRAMVGGREKGGGVFNRATQAKRQTGSAFKPFVYAAALELGWSPEDTVDDSPLTIDIPGSGPWSPQNYTKEFYGPVTLTRALRDSLNIPAVRVSEAVGRDVVRKIARDFGLAQDLADGPALALGVSDATLMEMTAAYAGILAGGNSVPPFGLTQLQMRGSSEVFAAGLATPEQVISTPAARQLIYMMHQVVEAGSGQRARLDGREVAGKTGTTQAARDAWFIGFSADYVAGVWMGYDDNTPLRGVTGGGLPAEIWREVMTRIHVDLPPQPLPMDPPIAPRDQPSAPIPDGGLDGILRRILGF